MESTTDRVIRVIRNSMGLDHDPLAGHCIEDVGGDSLDLVEFLGDLEDEFDVEIADGIITMETQFAEIAALIEPKL